MAGADQLWHLVSTAGLVRDIEWGPCRRSSQPDSDTTSQLGKAECNHWASKHHQLSPPLRSCTRNPFEHRVDSLSRQGDRSKLAPTPFPPPEIEKRLLKTFVIGEAWACLESLKMVRNGNTMEKPWRKSKKGGRGGEKMIYRYVCVLKALVLPDTRQGGPSGVLWAGWAVAAGRVWGPSLEERMRTVGHPVMAKTLHIGCALMTPLETETVWLLHDKMHCTVFYLCLISDFLWKDCIGRTS